MVKLAIGKKCTRAQRHGQQRRRPAVTISPFAFNVGEHDVLSPRPCGNGDISGSHWL